MTVYSHSSFHQPADDMVFLLCCHKPEKRQKSGERLSLRHFKEAPSGSQGGKHGADTGSCSCGQPCPSVMPGAKARRHHRRHQPCFQATGSASSKASCLSCLFPPVIGKRQRHFIGYELLLMCSAHVRLCSPSLKRPIFLFGGGGKNKIQTATNCT